MEGVGRELGGSWEGVVWWKWCGGRGGGSAVESWWRFSKCCGCSWRRNMLGRVEYLCV